MRWLINYVRQCFCKHDFKSEELWHSHTSDFGYSREGPKISLLCKKCGYHKSFWKF